jgi:hypothetical protein
VSSTSLLSDLAAYLDANSTALDTGRTLFYLQMPASTSSPNVSSTRPVAALIPAIGLPAVRRFTQAGAGAAMERATMKVIVRSTDGGAGDPSPLRAWQLIHEIYNLVETFPPNSTVAGGTHGTIHNLEPFQTPYLEDRDERNRYEFVFNLDCWA